MGRGACVAASVAAPGAPAALDRGGGMIDEQREQWLAPSGFGCSQTAQFIGRWVGLPL